MERRIFKSVMWAMAGAIAVLVFGALSFRHNVELGASGPLYLLLILLVAWRAGFRASVPVILSATLGLDFFYTEPRLTLRMASPSDVFAVVSFAAVALLVSHLSHGIRLSAEQTKHEEEKQRILYDLSRTAILIDWKGDVDNHLCKLIATRCKLSAVALWSEREDRVYSAGDAASLLEGVQASCRQNKDSDNASRHVHVRVLRFGTRNVGAIGFRGELDLLMADAIATLVATNMERVRALNAEVSAKSQMMSEQLRTAVLDGLAHAVKTPLATILLSASGLREVGALSPLQHNLAQTIETQSTYLADLTSELLRTAKLDGAVLVLRRNALDLSETLGDVLRSLAPYQDIQRIHLHAPYEVISIDADSALLRMALTQVLENALKYSPSGSCVDVHLSSKNGMASVSVHNEGTFIPSEERGRIFERYYRSPSVGHRAPGTGVGLSVTKRAMEAHGGRVHVESSPESGTTFVLSLPRKE